MEEWRPVVGKFAGWQYEVSDLGRAASLRRKRRIIAGGTGVGYRQVLLIHDSLKKPSSAYLHVLVYEAFRGLRNGKVINHIDGNKRNNRLDNLELVTHRENTLHHYRIIAPAMFSEATPELLESLGSVIHTLRNGWALVRDGDGRGWRWRSDEGRGKHVSRRYWDTYAARKGIGPWNGHQPGVRTW